MGGTSGRQDERQAEQAAGGSADRTSNRQEAGRAMSEGTSGGRDKRWADRGERTSDRGRSGAMTAGDEDGDKDGQGRPGATTAGDKDRDEDGDGDGWIPGRVQPWAMASVGDGRRG